MTAQSETKAGSPVLGKDLKTASVVDLQYRLHSIRRYAREIEREINQRLRC